MSKMSNLVFEITEMLEDNVPVLAIAATLDVTTEVIWTIKDNLQREAYRLDY
jgi:hypothetical protein|tara:strand:- start:815 stop:970 length:156 start_codon:yes stop_codon:yes gene_type:complete